MSISLGKANRQLIPGQPHMPGCKSNSPTRHSIYKIGSVFIAILNTILLSLLGVTPYTQLGVFIIFCLITSLGLLVLRKNRMLIPDTIALLALSALIGIGVFTLFNYVTFHFPSVIRPALFTFCLFSLIFLLHQRATIISSIKPFKTLFTPQIIFYVFLLSFFMSFITVDGFNNHPPHDGFYSGRNLLDVFNLIREGYVPNWGKNWDKNFHLIRLVKPIISDGLPQREVAYYGHYGTQVFFIAVNHILGGASAQKVVHIYKVTGFIFFFFLFYLIAFMGKWFFYLSPKGILLSLLAVCFFGAINYPLFTVRRSSYSGFFCFSGYYHNVPMLISTLIALGGIILYFFSLETEKKTFVAAMFLFSVSFLFKPTFFPALAVTVFFLLPFYRNRFSFDRIFGYFLLAAVPLYLLLYHALVPVKSFPIRIAIEPFSVLFSHASGRFPSFIEENSGLFAMAIFLCSFAITIPIVLDLAARLIMGSKSEAGEDFNVQARSRLKYLFFGVLLFFGLTQSIIFIEADSQWRSGNFFWTFQQAYLLSVPILVKFILQIRNNKLRYTAYALLALHFWGGVLRMARFVVGKF